jgi:hypothetical protein
MTKSASRPVSRTKMGVEQEVPSLYERIGAEKVERLVATFYARVEGDPPSVWEDAHLRDPRPD